MKLLGGLVLVAACGDDGTPAPAIDAHVFVDAPADASPYVACGASWKFMGQGPTMCDPKCTEFSALGHATAHSDCDIHDHDTGAIKNCMHYGLMVEDGTGCCETADVNTVVFEPCI